MDSRPLPDAKAQRAELLRNPDFRWLTSGGAISMLGDQFTLLALPWLVLKMTGDTRVLGLVLALVGVPRAIFILVGGALVDRYSPGRVLMLTKYVNTVLLALLAALVCTGHAQLQAVCAISLAIGVASAFSIPSGMSMMPHVLEPHLLGAANGITMGMRQLSMLLGPMLAGALIAIFGTGGGSAGGTLQDARGIAIAFAFDAASFAFSAWTQSHVRMRPLPPASGPAPAVLHSIAEGLRHFWRDAELRTCFGYWAAMALLIMGPLQIALPVLANSTSALGASALGLMLGAHGAGTLAGMVVSGAGVRVRIGTLGTTLLAFDALAGLLLIPLGEVSASWQGSLLLLAMGALAGFMQVSVFTWLQRRVPPRLIGRAMSLFMFIFMGIVPLSAAMTGWVMRAVTLPQLFAGCGAALIVIALLAALLTPMRQVRDPLTAA
jgi:predicted MFS family arabinose efflux permease